MNESGILFYMGREYYREIFPPLLLKDIPDFVFQTGSGWNTAINLSNYFELGEDYSFYSMGSSNWYGELVNATIEGEMVKFMPMGNFTGDLEFRMGAENSEGDIRSNYFTVTVNSTGIPGNAAPVFEGDIPDEILPAAGSSTINLSTYFSDPENGTLSYSTDGVENLNITFNGEIMLIKLFPNLTTYERFKVVASDGVSETRSNRINISLLVPVVVPEEEPEIEIDNSSLLAETGNASSASATNSSSGGAGLNDIGFWMMIIAGIVLCLLIAGAAAYFAFVKKSPVAAPVQTPAQARVDPVDNYLKKINSDQPPARE